MKYEDNTLSLDLSKEAYDITQLLQYRDIRKLRIDDVTGEITLPLELNEFPNLEEIYISGGNRDSLYPPPVNLEKLTNIKKLTLWSFCDLAELPALPHIRQFDVVVKHTANDTRAIVSAMPNLQRMELWGSHMKEGELPPEIAQLAKLEELELVSCGLRDLPEAFAQLQSLKKLSIRGVHMRTFPTAICGLTDLQELAFNQHISKLPDEFANLINLHKLDFSQAFNEGTLSPVDKYGEGKVYLKPLPEVIGRLPLLAELDLSMCGVEDIGFLKNAGQLRKLKIEYSALVDCADFAGLIALEDLDLENAEALENIDGLAGLPLRRLKLESCDELADISVLESLTQLEELNIEGCSGIDDLDPIYVHPTLTTLTADDDVQAQWQLREKFKNLPTIEEVVAATAADEPAVFEQAVADLKLYVDKNYHDDNNPLAGYFGEEADNEELVSLPQLEQGLAKHHAAVSIDTLLTLVDISLRSVTNDNYNITVQAIEELIERKDVEAQKQVISYFDKACAYYDFGHRFWESTVLDQLYDDLFPEFEAAALLELLRDGHSDMMNSEGGDGADALFVPAFSRCKDEETFTGLMDAFFEYQDECLGYFGSEYFIELQQGIIEVLPEEWITRLNNQSAARSQTMELMLLLESDKPDDVRRLIAMCGQSDFETFFDDKYYEILDAIDPAQISYDEAVKAMNYCFVRNKGASRVADLLRAYFPEDQIAVAMDYLRDKQAQYSKFVIDVVDSIIYELHRNLSPMQAIEPWRDYLQSLNGKEANELYAREIRAVFKRVTDSGYRDNPEVDMQRLLDLVQQLSGRVYIRDLDLSFQFYFMVDGEEYEKVFLLADAMFDKLEPRVFASSLYLVLVAAIHSDDRERFYRYLQYLPEQVEEQLLAYNLACGFAAFHDRENMLKYIQISLELGKTAEQFIDDADFAAYLQDQDFQSLLATA
ncbi:MAG: hypothetical protein OEZ39_17910 [Gammaproteobacteria bacterium]|nr:hypothetical protein [Gammaproteobacteria bacterium]MDH5653742.1 hypothetical protein [Gammaproteobacteria bacterium]